MTDIPSATIENARPPLWQRPAVRRVIGVAIIVVSCVIGWRLLKIWMRPAASKALAARQERARAVVGDAFDAIFDDQLATGSSAISFDATFVVAPGLGDGYDASGCARGLDDAFSEAMGPDVITFTASPYEQTPNQLRLEAKLTPHGAGFQLPNSPTVYPGIAMAADVHFLGKDWHLDATPSDAIEFEHTVLAYDLTDRGPSASQVARGVLQGTCKELGLQLLEAITTWKRPPPPEKPDPVKECDQGFHCRDNAALLAEREPLKAARMYAQACNHDDDLACTQAADLVVEAVDAHRKATKGDAKATDLLDGSDAYANLVMPVEMACRMDSAAACEGAGRLSLIRYGAASDYSRRQALLLFLRACDLGSSTACAEAAPLVAGTPFGDAAPLLRGDKTLVVSKTLGTVFALKWGQWSRMDIGQPTAWVTKLPAVPPQGAQVTTFTVGSEKFPKGITPPSGATAIHAIALEPGHGDYDQPCGSCVSSSRSKSATIPALTLSLGCVCALLPPTP